MDHDDDGCGVMKFSISCLADDIVAIANSAEEGGKSSSGKQITEVSTYSRRQIL
jgi:hypothetical protein